MKVFIAYDNQYLNEENAKWIIDNFGNPCEQIKEVEYNENQPLFTIQENEQVELILEGNINILWEGSEQPELIEVYSWKGSDNESWYSILDEENRELYFGERSFSDLKIEIAHQGHLDLRIVV